MLIKEIEALSGMDRANIRFYEREGFINPRRMDNGYRDYSDTDLQLLLRIKLLRSIHIPLDEIRALKDGDKELADTLSDLMMKLEQEKQGISYAQDICCTMRQDKASFTNLDAGKYLDMINQVEETDSVYFPAKDDKLPQVYHPWRRYLARTFDISIYSILWSAFLAFVFHSNITTRNGLGVLFDSFMALAIMLVLEPLWLYWFGTTPGKAIFGLKIESSDGGYLSYEEGLMRTWSAIGAGMGYGIPIYNLIRLWKSYQLCSNNELQPWDESISYTIKDTKKYRGVLFVCANAALYAILFTIMAAQLLPPNRGNLTIAEFAKNHNYYAKFHDIDLANEYLDQNGEWAKRESDGTFYYDIGHPVKPEYQFITENGVVTGVSFAIEIRNNEEWINSYNKYMILSSLAFADAQSELRLYSNIPGRIAEQIQHANFEGFQFNEAGLMFTCDIEYSGYDGVYSDNLVPMEGSTENYFSLHFSVNKL